MNTRRGGCHCGAIRFEVDGDPADLVVCNCSICSMTGYMHWEVEPERFRLLTPDAEIVTYEFGTRTAKDHFCRTCGISPFRRSRTAPTQIDVNARCIEGLEPETLEMEIFDGRNWEQAAARKHGSQIG